MDLKDVQWKRYTHSINNIFFRTWTSQMAYILGFSFADGNLHNTSLRWDLSRKYKTNKKLLEDFNKAMSSSYPVSSRKNSYSLSISNRVIAHDIKNLGVIPCKKNIILFPLVPDNFLRHFIRGFLEGDGWISPTLRKNSRGYLKREISVGFSNGSKKFMESLICNLKRFIHLSAINLRMKLKTTKSGDPSYCYSIEFYSHSALEIIKFLYDDLEKSDITLGHKCEKQLRCREIYGMMAKDRQMGKLWRKFEEKTNIPIEQYLHQELIKKKKTAVQIAKDLETSSSTIYRLLQRTNIRSRSKRGSKIWKERTSKRRYKNKYLSK